MPRETDKPDDLYVIESSCGWMKIGRSCDTANRMASLTTSPT